MVYLKGEPWSDFEIRVALDSYFTMLLIELEGVPYSKSQHRKLAQGLTPDRSLGSVEFKWQNVSAILKELQLPWIEGLKPMSNYQDRLRELTAVWLVDHPHQAEVLRSHRNG